MKKLSSLLIFTVLFFSACNNTSDKTSSTDEKKFDLAAVRTAIDSSNHIYSDAVVKGDSATIAGSYSPDAKTFPPNMPVMGDSKSVAAMAGGFTHMGIKSFSVQATDVYGDASLVVEEGKYTVGDGAGKTLDEGKYIVLWKEVNGQWKMYRDIWNSNTPAPAPAK